MQGKPMNAWKVGLAKVQTNDLYRRLIEILGANVGDDFDLQHCRFERVILLFDPDADGIHGCSLMLWFFHRWMPQLLEAGRLFVANPPICELFDPASGRRAYPSHPHQRDKLLSEWKMNLQGDVAQRIQVKPFRGLASLGQELLFQTCISPDTRLLRKLGTNDAIASLRVFGMEPKPKKS